MMQINTNKKLLVLGLAFVVVVATFFAFHTIIFANSNKKVTSISITTPSTNVLYLKKGESFQLKTKVLPSNAGNKKLNYKSNNSSVAKVTTSGTIKAKKVGTSILTITSKDGSKKKATIKVKVLDKLVKAKKVSLNKTKVTLYTGGVNENEKITLTASVLPSTATVKSVIYISSDKKIATVSKEGVVTAVSKGNVKITAYAADGRGAKATCTVSVKVKPEITTLPTTVPTGNPTSAPMATPTATPTATPVIDSAIVKFSSQNNYRSYSSINIALPDGISAADVTSISFDVDTAKDLALRLYSGKKSESTELTSELSEVKNVDKGSSSTVVDGVTVTKNSHELTTDVKSSTRIAVKAGNRRNVMFSIDSNSKDILSKVSGNLLTLSIYAHNIKPEFSFYNLKITTATNTYEVTLDNSVVTSVNGGNISIQK